MPYFLDHTESLRTQWRNTFAENAIADLASSVKRRDGILSRVVENVYQRAPRKNCEESMVDLWKRSFFTPVHEATFEWRRKLSQTLHLNRETDPVDIFVYGALVAALHERLATRRVFASRKPTIINAYRTASRAMLTRAWRREPYLDKYFQFITNFVNFKNMMVKSPDSFTAGFDYQFGATLQNAMQDPVDLADFKKFSRESFIGAKKLLTGLLGDKLAQKAIQRTSVSLALLTGYGLEDNIHTPGGKAVEAIRYLHPRDADDIIATAIHTLYERLMRPAPHASKSAISHKLVAIERAHPPEERNLLSVTLKEWLDKIHAEIGGQSIETSPVRRVTPSGKPLRVIKGGSIK